MVRRKYIRLLVQRLLMEHGIRTAPVSVIQIAKALGVDVQETPAEEGLSGFLDRAQKENAAVIGVNSKHPPNRRNFTAAHELGHYLLHDFKDVHVDREFKIWLLNDASSKGIDNEEKEANVFDAELLMPARFVARDVEKISSIDPADEKVLQELASKYGVSQQAMTFRLAYLGHVKL